MIAPVLVPDTILNTSPGWMRSTTPSSFSRILVLDSSVVKSTMPASSSPLWTRVRQAIMSLRMTASITPLDPPPSRDRTLYGLARFGSSG